METIETTGKGKKAFYRLSAVNSDVKEIKGILSTARANITETLGQESKGSDPVIEFEPESTQREKPPGKLRGMISSLPDRVEFTCNSLKFYIDFTLLATESDNSNSIKGSIIYGISRTLCFSDCIFPKDKDTEKCERCERITRCDGLEDKPMIQFTVDRHGTVRSKGELDEEWRIVKEQDEEGKKKLSEFLYCTLDYIWKDALDWANENILP